MKAIRLFAMTVALCLGTAAIAQEGAEDLGIAPQPLNKALEEFADKSGLQVIYVADLAEGKDTSGAKANLSDTETLDQLLASTGLEYEFLNANTVTVQAVGDEERSSDSGKTRAAPRPVMMAQASEINRKIEGPENQDQQDPGVSKQRDQQVEEVVVTGTRLKGIAPESSPVLTFSREDIENSGFSSIEAFFRTVLQNSGSGIGEENYNVPGTSGADITEQGSGLNLRGLGQRATLTLLNGNRVAPTGVQGQAIDVSLIPLAAIDRIEILSVGASAIYGSDAVGGVVNFVLRDDFEGVETSLRVGTATDGDGDQLQASTALGTDWNSGNALLTYQFDYQQEILDRDRDFTLGIPDQTFLLPNTESNSIFGSLNQELTDRLSLQLTGLYSNRQTQRDTVRDTGVIQSNNADADLYSIAAKAVYDLNENWQATLNGSISHNESEIFDHRADDSFTREGQTIGDTYEVTASVAGNLFELPAGDVSIALGGQHRYLEYSSQTIINMDDQPPIENDISSNALFVEALIPLVSEENDIRGINRLELHAALRYEDYGGSVGDTLNPMVGVLWEPLDGFRFRGTYGTSFRAPLPSELTGSFQIRFFGDVDLLYADQDDPSRVNGIALIVTGRDTDIRPEESETFTAGFDFQPELVPGLTLEATYFYTEFTDRIAAPASSFAGVIGDPAFESIIERMPSQDTIDSLFANAAFIFDLRPFFFPDPPPIEDEVFSLIFDGRISNTESTITSGIDSSISYQVHHGGNELTFFGTGTYLFELEDRLRSTAPTVERSNTVFDHPRLKARTGLRWQNQALGASIFVNYTNSYDDVRFDPPAKVDSYTTVDMTMSYDVGASSDHEILSGTRFSLSVLNLLDQDPPFVGPVFSTRGVAYDPVNASARGRFVAATVAKRW